MIRQTKTPLSDQVLKAGSKRARRVTEPTFYSEDFSIYLRERFNGQTVSQVADALGVAEEQVGRWLDGAWRPDKATCKKLGLQIVYAIGEGTPAC